MLKEKAEDFAKSLGHNFRASNRWLGKFKQRNYIVFPKVCRESASVDDNICKKLERGTKNNVERL